MRMYLPLYSVVAAVLLGTGVALAAESEQATQKPYTVVDGRSTRRLSMAGDATPNHAYAVMGLTGPAARMHRPWSTQRTT